MYLQRFDYIICKNAEIFLETVFEKIPAAELCLGVYALRYFIRLAVFCKP